MSKRYGRNQKRKAREEVSRLQHVYLREQGLLRWYGEELQKARDDLDRLVTAIEKVSKHSALLPPKTVEGTGPVHQCRLLRRSPLGSPPRGPVDLYALEMSIQENELDMQTAVHLNYTRGPRAVYMISEQALLMLSEEDLVRHFAPEVVRALLRHIRGQ